MQAVSFYSAAFAFHVLKNTSIKQTLSQRELIQTDTFALRFGQSVDEMIDNRVDEIVNKLIALALQLNKPKESKPTTKQLVKIFFREEGDDEPVAEHIDSAVALVRHLYGLRDLIQDPIKPSSLYRTTAIKIIFGNDTTFDEIPDNKQLPHISKLPSAKEVLDQSATGPHSEEDYAALRKRPDLKELIKDSTETPEEYIEPELRAKIIDLIDELCL